MNNRLSKTSDIVILVAVLIIVAFVARLLPHPPNFAPVAAIALLGGAILPRRAAIALPLAVIILSDLVIGLHSTIIWTWGSFAIIALLASNWFSRITATRVVGASLGASFLFFIVTNFGVWFEGFLYPRTYEGLVAAYTMAIPFFRNTLLGDLFYSGVLFAAYAALRSHASLPNTVKSNNR